MSNFSCEWPWSRTIAWLQCCWWSCLSHFIITMDEIDFFFLVLSNSFHRFDIKPRDPFVNCNAKHVSDSHNNKKWRKLNDPKSKSINYDDDNSVIRSFLFFLKLHNHFKQIFPFELCVIYIFFGQKQMWLVRWWFWFISKKNEMKKKIWMKSKSFLKGHKPLTKKKSLHELRTVGSMDGWTRYGFA